MWVCLAVIHDNETTRSLNVPSKGRASDGLLLHATVMPMHCKVKLIKDVVAGFVGKGGGQVTFGHGGIRALEMPYAMDCRLQRLCGVYKKKKENV
jgi:hypothetical protein